MFSDHSFLQKPLWSVIFGLLSNLEKTPQNQNEKDKLGRMPRAESSQSNTMFNKAQSYFQGSSKDLKWTSNDCIFVFPVQPNPIVFPLVLVFYFIFGNFLHFSFPFMMSDLFNAMFIGDGVLLYHNSYAASYSIVCL